VETVKSIFTDKHSVKNEKLRKGHLIEFVVLDLLLGKYFDCITNKT